jgi:3'-phosphoadenosine 5'-phosphosulfate sulfotransferase (PAPS reductase)/FAD synthetase
MGRLLPETRRQEGIVTGRRVVMFSGGVASWATAKRVAADHGTDGLTLLFADTQMEDEDTYRFLEAGATNVGGTSSVSLTAVTSGRCSGTSGSSATPASTRAPGS